MSPERERRLEVDRRTTRLLERIDEAIGNIVRIDAEEAVDANGVAAIENALLSSGAAWRTIGSLSKETGIPPVLVERYLNELGTKVRNPLFAHPDEQNLVRHVSRGYTRQEWARYIRRLLARRP